MMVITDIILEHSYVFIALILLCFLFIRFRRSWKLLSSRRGKSAKSVLDFEGEKGEKTPIPMQSMGVIEPLKDLKWDTVEPKRIYKFSPKYFLTMGLQSTTINHITHIDKLYLSRLLARRQILADHPDAIACLPSPSAIGMVNELYSYLTSTYLPQRYPTIFQLQPTQLSATHLLNTLTGDFLPLTPPSDPLLALRLLATTVDDDFIMLLPSSSKPPPTGPITTDTAAAAAAEEEEDPTAPIPFSLQAHIWCYPAGFHPRNLLGLPLAAIHAPVPGYASKLAKSMDRYFARLEVGRVVTRTNWSIATASNLWEDGLSGNAHHIYEDTPLTTTTTTTTTTESSESSSSSSSSSSEAEVDMSQCFLRCELQTLFALPKSGARVMALHLYMYPMVEIKEGEKGETSSVAGELCDAIDGLKKGNVPEMWRYKRAVVWGEKVKEFLRS